MNAQVSMRDSNENGNGSRPYFSVRDIHAYYGESYIVQGVSFDINEGEVLALLGRNGAGKTSTLRSIARTGDPEVHQGEIWLNNNALHDMKSYEAAQHGAVARALARDVKLLLLDEPYEGLAPVIVQEIEKVISQIRDIGITTIIVEQNAVAALSLADRAVILDTGHVVYDGSAEAVLNDEHLAPRQGRGMRKT